MMSLTLDLKLFQYVMVFDSTRQFLNKFTSCIRAFIVFNALEKVYRSLLNLICGTRIKCTPTKSCGLAISLLLHSQKKPTKMFSRRVLLFLMYNYCCNQSTDNGSVIHYKTALDFD